MFQPEVLPELQKLPAFIPGLSTLRIRYTDSSLFLTTGIIDPESASGKGIMLFFATVLFALFTFSGYSLHLWILASIFLLITVTCGIALFYFNRRVNTSQHMAPDFIIDTTSRWITLPSIYSWWRTTPVAGIPFEDVTGIRALMISADDGYGEIAQLEFSLHNKPYQRILLLRSYALTKQLATVLQQIILPNGNISQSSKPQ